MNAPFRALATAGVVTSSVEAANHRFLVHLTLNHVESMLPPAAFHRVHRKYIVNHNYIAELVPRRNAQFELGTADGDRLITSRWRSRELRGVTL